MKAWYKPYQLKYKKPILTSRGSMDVKNGYYIFISDGSKTGIGECSFIEGLSIDNLDNYEQILQRVCEGITNNTPTPLLTQYPSIQFGYETALLDYHTGGKKVLFDSAFTQGTDSIPINGLIWMADKDTMLAEIEQKLKAGFNCIKLKVGAIDFNDEVKLISYIRQQFPKQVIEIRLDANGAFNSTDVYHKLEALAQFDIHSIEQPIKPKQWPLLQQLCHTPLIPIALDEELIGMQDPEEMERLLSSVRPQYIILKPSLVGGLNACNKWIALAGKYNIGWWATSALESNIGLNAIAQWVYGKSVTMVQGLGTGSLYLNNVESPLTVSDGRLIFDANLPWGTIQ